jgi:hypothetical protein
MGRPSNEGEMKAGSTVGRFAMAWRWAAAQCGTMASEEVAALSQRKEEERRGQLV